MNLGSGFNLKRYQWECYGVAVLTVAIALLLELLLKPLASTDSPSLIFLAAVLVSARFGGLPAGVLATVLSALVSNFFLWQLLDSFPNLNWGQNLQIFLFVVEGMAISKVIAALKSAKQQAEVTERNALQHQETFWQSEERYRQLVELSPDTIFIQCEGKFVFINSAGVKLFGATDPEQLIGKSVLDFIHPDYQATVQQRLQQLQAGNTVPLIAEKFVRLDGTFVDVEVAASPFTYQGQPAAQVVSRDITQRQQAAEVLSRAKAELEINVEQRTTELCSANQQLQTEIHERQRTEQALWESQIRLRLINSISTASIMLDMAVEPIIERTVKQIGKHFKTLRVAYTTVDRQGKLTVIHAVQPETMPQQQGLEVDLTAAPEYLNLLRLHKPIIINSITQDSRLASSASVMANAGIQALINVPFEYSDDLLGLLCFESASFHNWSKHEITTLVGVTQYLSLIIKNARTEQKRKQAEAALRLLESAVQQINEAITITSAQLDLPGPQIIFVNPAFTRLTGYTSEEVIGKTPRILHGAKTDYSVMQQLRRSLEQEETFFGETINYRKDGTEFYMEWHIVAIKNESGVTTNFVAIQRDVTERRRREQEIRFLQTITQAISTSADFNSALEVAMHKVCEATDWNFGEAWIPNHDHTVLECSPAWYCSTDRLDEFRRLSQRFCFLPGQGLPGRIWVSKRPEWHRDVSVEPETIYYRSQIAMKCGIKAALGVPVIANNNVLAVLVFYKFESDEEDTRLIEIISASTQLGLLVQRKRAEEALRKAHDDLEVRVRERTAELAKANSELRTEIIERQRVEQELRASEERLRLALKAAQMSDWDWNILNNRITYANNQALMPGTISSYLEDTYEAILERVDPRDRRSFMTAVKRSLTERLSYDHEFRVVGVDGEIRWLVSKGQVFYDQTGTTAVRMTGIIMDVTERKQVAEQIQASLKEKEVLLKEIHHRVKNNLQIISSLLSLQSAYVEDKRILDLLKASENRIASMAMIHEQLYQSKDLARIDFAGYIENLAANLLSSYEIDSNNIILTTEVENVVLDVDAAIPCGLIINELISNSLKYAFPHGTGGEIYINIHPESEDRLVMAVGDDGIGFPAEMDFQNTESLGLQIVTALTNQLEGTIELNTSQGTEFKIKFCHTGI